MTLAIIPWSIELNTPSLLMSAFNVYPAPPLMPWASMPWSIELTMRSPFNEAASHPSFPPSMKRSPSVSATDGVVLYLHTSVLS